MPAGALNEFLDRLVLDHGSRLIRVKGMLAIADGPRTRDHPRRAGIFSPPVRLAAWPDGDRRSRLVVIGRDLDRAACRSSSTALGEPRPDTPDRPALFDNPLAIAGDRRR